MLHGNGKFGTRETVVEAGPGDTLYFAPWEEHFLKNIGSHTLEFVFIYSPPGDEKLIKETWVPLPERA